jgi:hypothetical protein
MPNISHLNMYSPDFIISYFTVFDKPKAGTLFLLLLRIIVLFLGIFLIFFLNGCSQNHEFSIKLPPTQALERFPGYAVVQKNYSRVFTEAKMDSGIQAMYRAGDILSLAGRTQAKYKSGGNLDYWYFCEGEQGQGWIFGADLILCYDNKMAEHESLKILSSLSRE